MAESCFEHCNHKIRDFFFVVLVKKVVSRTDTMDVQRSDFGFFRDLVDSIPCSERCSSPGRLNLHQE